jgi:NAD-dependent oxidoreductase involved in siderophore biosynthesis
MSGFAQTRGSVAISVALTGKVCTMAKLKYIASANEIPAGQKYLLVMYGEQYAQTRHPLGLTITVARQSSKTVSELSFLTAVHTAKGIAKREGISEIFVCTATTPWPTILHPAAVPTSSG